MAKQALIRFPGITATKGGIVNVSRGPFPSTALIYFAPQTSLSLNEGTLTCTYGGDTVSFPNAIPDHATLRRRKTTSGVYLWSILIYDRRKKWERATITGKYNQRLADGTRKNSATLQTLAGTLLAACGESSWAVGDLPALVYPEVDWKGDNPALELDKLADDAGCDIVLRNNVTDVVKRGSGSNLPNDNSRRVTPLYTFKPNGAPSAFQVAGGPNVIDGRLLLEAVGVDTDGKIKKIVNLSYKPAQGWGREHPLQFAGVSIPNRYLALNSVYRMYRVKGMSDGTLTVPGMNITLNSADQIKIRDHQAKLDDDDYPIRSQIFGTFWNYSEVYANTDACTPYHHPWHLDLDNNLVIFDNFVVQYDVGAGCYKAPELFLQTSYTLENNSGQPMHYSRTVGAIGEVTTAVPGSTSVIYRPELWELITHHFANCATFANPKYTSNVDSIDTEADSWLAAHRNQFVVNRDQRTLEYEGIKKIDLNGKRAQVTYDIGHLKDHVTTTIASENFEHDTGVAPAGERRARREALR